MTVIFDQALYLEEITRIIDKAVRRIQSEKPDFKIYTVNIWTDPNATVSSIGFDNRENSLSIVKKSNEWSKKYDEQYIAEGDLEQAKLFKPNTYTRVCNPTDFELRDFEKTTYHSFPKNWETETNGNRWEELEPALTEVGKTSFQKIKNLNVEGRFELSINSSKDWYDKT